MPEAVPKYGAPTNHCGLILPANSKHVADRAIELAMEAVKAELTLAERVELLALSVWHHYNITPAYLDKLVLWAYGLPESYLEPDYQGVRNSETVNAVRRDRAVIKSNLSALAAGRSIES